VRVLFVTWDGPQVSYLQSLFLPIFKRLKLHGFEFDVLQFRWGDPEQEQAVALSCQSAGIGYRAINIWRWGGSVGPFLSALWGGRHVRRAIRDFGSDVIMPRSVLPSLAVLAGRAWRSTPVLMDADGLEIDERAEFAGMSTTGAAYRILRDVEAQMVRRSRSIIVRTVATRDILLARAGPAVDETLFHKVTNGRDEHVFQLFDEQTRGSVRDELGMAPEAPLIVYAGSVGARYRTRAIGEFALELKKLRPDTRLLILSGSPETAGAELCSALPQIEEFTTIMRVEPGEVPRYLASADVGTALIKSTFSTLGISPVKTGEYLLCGVPVVGTAEVGDNAAPIAEGVFFDEGMGLDSAARWVSEAVLSDREGYRQRARSVGLAHFSLGTSVTAYLAALDQLTVILNNENASAATSVEIG
jgi:glycosyltransferase involved in cell wall biosynthesis